MVTIPVVVIIGLNVPQLLPPAGVQVADQVTPLFEVSFWIVATTGALEPTVMFAGGGVEIVTDRTGLVTVVLAFATAGLSTDVAVIVTGNPPVGTVLGAV